MKDVFARNMIPTRIDEGDVSDLISTVSNLLITEFNLDWLFQINTEITCEQIKNVKSHKVWDVVLPYTMYKILGDLSSF